MSVLLYTFDVSLETKQKLRHLQQLLLHPHNNTITNMEINVHIVVSTVNHFFYVTLYFNLVNNSNETKG